jgi:hypothetical protein
LPLLPSLAPSARGENLGAVRAPSGTPAAKDANTDPAAHKLAACPDALRDRDEIVVSPINQLHHASDGRIVRDKIANTSLIPALVQTYGRAKLSKKTRENRSKPLNIPVFSLYDSL